MKEMETVRPFNILDVINLFREIIRDRSVMKDDIEADCGNEKITVEGIVYFPTPMIALENEER